MNVETTIRTSGVVTSVGGGNLHNVLLIEGVTVMAYRRGRMVQNKISVVVGDRVTVELPVTDPRRGRIVVRK